MRILTVFFMSTILCLLGVLYVVFPGLWFNGHLWDSPLFWGGAVVLAAWWGSIRALTADVNPQTGRSGPGGAGLIVIATTGTGLLMLLIS